MTHPPQLEVNPRLDSAPPSFWRDTILNCASSFSAALARLDADQSITVVCSHPQHYAWMKEFYPDLFAKIKTAVADGRWEIIGAMWLAADTGVVSGESIARQILHGRTFFLEEFGAEPAIALLPERFQCSAALPQLMRQAGVRHLVGKKIPGIPHDTFWWEGLDGTRVLVHTDVFDFENAGFNGLPAFLPRRLADFVAEKSEEMLPVWVGELRGISSRCTTDAPARRSTRKSEVLLRDAEFFEVIAGGQLDFQPAQTEADIRDTDRLDPHAPHASLARAWHTLLLNEGPAADETSPASQVARERDFDRIAALGHAVSDAAKRKFVSEINTSGFTKPCVLFNTSSFWRDEVVTLPDGSPAHALVPPCGYAVIETSESEQRPVASFAKPVEVIERKKLLALDNGMLRLIFDRQSGQIRSIRDHRLNREVLAPDENGNVFQLHGGGGCEAISCAKNISVIEKTDLRATVRIEHTFGSSRIAQKISLSAGTPRIDFDTEVDWREKDRSLKVAFPVQILARSAKYEIQYGHAERPTHRNGKWHSDPEESCGQRWVDFSEGDYGVTLLNDGKYGHEVFDKMMRMHLLAGSDARGEGAHCFKYGLVPHVGDYRSATVEQHACALNIPMHIVATEPHGGSRPKQYSFLSHDRPGVLISAIKKAEHEDAMIVRLHEAYGTRGPVTLTTSFPFKQVAIANLLEQTIGAAEFEDDHVTVLLAPFEIVTLKFLTE